MDTLESSSSGERAYVGQSVVGESILFREYPVDIKHVLGLSTLVYPSVQRRFFVPLGREHFENIWLIRRLNNGG